MSKPASVAIIGSFKQHYENVCQAWRALTDLGIEVTSPKGTPIIEPGIPFVRFVSDDSKWDDPMVQTVALHRILRADFVFVVAPSGYVGRTTCYEIGRIIQSLRPLYFSEHPVDLPIQVSNGHVLDLSALVDQIKTGSFNPSPLFYNEATPLGHLETDLLNGAYRTDEEISK